MTDTATSTCPFCGTEIAMFNRSLIGQQVICPACAQTFSVLDNLDNKPMLNSDSGVATPGADGPQSSRKASRGRFSQVVGIIALVVLAGIGLAMWKVARPHTSRASIDFAWIPPHAEAIVYIRPADLLKSSFVDWLIEQGAAREMLRESLEKIRSEAGFSIDDIESITIGMRYVGDLAAGANAIKPGQTPDLFQTLITLGTLGQKEVVAVVRLSQLVDLTKNQTFQSMTEAVTYHGGITYFRDKPFPGAPASGFIYFPSPRVIVICGREDVLQDLIIHGGKAEPRPEMEIIDPSQHLVLATVMTRDLKAIATTKGRGLTSDFETLNGVQAVCLGITVTDGLEISMRQRCVDQQTTQDLHAAIEKLIPLGLDEYRKAMPFLTKNMGLVGDAMISSAKSAQKELVVETILNLPAKSRENLRAIPNELFTALMAGGASEGTEDKPTRSKPSAAGFSPQVDKEEFRGAAVIVEKLEGLPKGLLLRGRAGWMPDGYKKKNEGQPLARLLTFDIEYGGEIAGRIVEIGNLQIKKIETDPAQFLKLTTNPDAVLRPSPFHGFVDKRSASDIFSPYDCVQIRLHLEHPDVAPTKLTIVEGEVTLRVATETKSIMIPELLSQIGKPVTDPDLKAAGFEIISEVGIQGEEFWIAYFARTAKVDDFRVVRADGKRMDLAPIVMSWDQFGKPGYAIGSNAKPPAGLAGKVILHTQFEELTVPFRFENVPVIECPDKPYAKGTPWGLSTAKGSPKATVVVAQLQLAGGFKTIGDETRVIPSLRIDVTGPAFRYVLGAANKKIDTAVTNSSEELEFDPRYHTHGFEYVGYDFQSPHYPPDGATVVFYFKSRPMPFESLETVTGSCRLLVAEAEKRTVIEKLSSHVGRTVTNADLDAAGLEFQIDQIDMQEKEVRFTVTKGNNHAIRSTDLIPAVTSDNSSFLPSYEKDTMKGKIGLRDYTIKPDDSMEIIYYTGIREIEIPFAFSKLIAPPPKPKD
ncbi:MAG: hypothetical protein JWM11_5760 [Planctomycetaceae bacterium]|nr:hypothetical protein [Planctomycetaceae bacterium]